MVFRPAHCPSGSTPETNVVRIPDPAKFLDPLYLTAHSLVDQLPRPALAALMPILERALRAAPPPSQPQDLPPPDLSPRERGALLPAVVPGHRM